MSVTEDGGPGGGKQEGGRGRGGWGKGGGRGGRRRKSKKMETEQADRAASSGPVLEVSKNLPCNREVFEADNFCGL